MTVNPPETGTWIKPLGDVFLGLNSSAVIRRIIGVIEILPSMSARQIQGLTWDDFVTQYAAEPAQDGLKYAWRAMSQQHVAPQFWPSYLPFKPGIIARLRPIDDDPIISFVVHLSTDAQYDYLNAITNKILRDAVRKIMLLSQDVYRGAHGPLTDLQVRHMGTILDYVEHAQQLLADLRAEVFIPAVSAPIPHAAAELLAFAASDFPEHRVVTHALSIRCDISDAAVYCQPEVRPMVQHLLGVLLTHISPQSAITLSDSASSDAVNIHIRYRTPEPELQTGGRIDPLTLTDPARFQKQRTIERLITKAQACISPVHGQAWAESCPDADTTGCITLKLPRWQGTLPDRKDI